MIEFVMRNVHNNFALYTIFFISHFLQITLKIIFKLLANEKCGTLRRWIEKNCVVGMNEIIDFQPVYTLHSNEMVKLKAKGVATAKMVLGKTRTFPRNIDRKLCDERQETNIYLIKCNV